MRRVACYVASSELASAESIDAAMNPAVDVIGLWLRGKGLPSFSEGKQVFSLPDGRPAIASIQRTVSGNEVVWETILDETNDTGHFLTRICLGIRGRAIHLFLEMRAGATGYELAPVRIEVRCPHVLRSLFGLRGWMVGLTPVYLEPIEWHGDTAGSKFLDLVRHSERNLPIVAISRFHGDPLSPTLPEDLARDLAGLAIIADLDEPASWSISQQEGREWSCYNGAVRLYWPMRGPDRNAYDHPLWTRERLVEQAGSAAQAASRIRGQIRRWVLELSTYAVDEPSALVEIRADASRARIDALRRAAADRGDVAAFAEEIADRCADLEVECESLKRENEELKMQVASLSQGWHWNESEADQTVAPDAQEGLRSVAEAVERAKVEFAAELVFGGDVHDSVDTLAADAGPPEKVFDYLRGLAEMTRQRRVDGLGKDMLSWLSERGLKASGESETVLNSPAETRRRTWHDGTGRRAFRSHLKPSDGTSPDRCVRIYFDYDNDSKKTLVGYIGRHF